MNEDKRVTHSPTAATRVFLVSGEQSGDIHGAELMKSLRAASDQPVEFQGLGGPRMGAVGGEGIANWIEEAAVVGIWEVLKHYGYFRQRFDEAIQQIDAWKPEAVILIDYPGFNLRLAKALREKRYPGKIIYYISPQVWAWNRRRIPKMAGWLDLMICIFPFEKVLYETSGLPTVFAGHPLVDELTSVPRREREEALVGLFPGSRTREVNKLFPDMLKAVDLLRRRHSELRFEVAAASERIGNRMRELLSESGLSEKSIVIVEGETHALMQRATAGLVASGTATLEAAWFGLPYALVYRVAVPTYWIGRALVKIQFIGIANILAEREVVRELIQDDATPEKLSEELESLLYDQARRDRLEQDLALVAAKLGPGGAHYNAAAAVLSTLYSNDR